jgi:hypothetical protein
VQRGVRMARPKKPQGPNAHRVLPGAPRTKPRSLEALRLPGGQIKPPTKRGARAPDYRARIEQATGRRAALKRLSGKRKGPLDSHGRKNPGWR